MVPGPHRACAFDKACRSSYIRTCMKELFPLRVFGRGEIVLAARAKSFRQSGRKAVKHSEYNVIEKVSRIHSLADRHFKIFIILYHIDFFKTTIFNTFCRREWWQKGMAHNCQHILLYILKVYLRNFRSGCLFPTLSVFNNNAFIVFSFLKACILAC